MIFQNYSYSQGLTTYSINKAIEDSFGFIWVATQDGIFRFNGNSFEKCMGDGTNSYSTAGSYYYDISMAGDEIFGTSYNKGIDTINIITQYLKPGNNRGKHNEVLKDNLGNLFITSYMKDKSGTDWIGGADFFAFKGKEDREYRVLREIPETQTSTNTTFIKQIGNNNVVVALVGGGLLLFSGNKSYRYLKNLNSGKLSTTEQFKDAFFADNLLYLLTNDRIYVTKLNSDNIVFSHHYKYKEIENSTATCFVKDSRGNFWIGTNDGLIKYNQIDKTTEHIRQDPYRSRWLVENSIRDLMLDSNENLWICTAKSLQTLNLRPGIFQSYTGEGKGNIRIGQTYNIVKQKESKVFCCSLNGLYTVDMVTSKSQLVPNSSSFGTIHFIYQAPNNKWVVSSDRGMCLYDEAKNRLSKQEFLNYYPEWRQHEKRYFNNCVKIGNCSYWSSEEEQGIFKWDETQKTITQFKARTKQSGGLKENLIHLVKFDSGTKFWVISDNYVLKFDASLDTVVEQIITPETPGLGSAAIFFDVYQNNDKIFVASYGSGLLTYDKMKKKWSSFNTKTGLSNDQVYGILPVSDSVIWVSTNFGLNKINILTNKVENFFLSDGLHDNAFDQCSFLKGEDYLLFGGVGGFTRVNHNVFNVQEISTPKIFAHKIEYFTDKGNEVLFNLTKTNYSLPSGTSSINLHLSASNKNNAGDIEYLYKIRSLNKDFIKADKNLISLNGLSHGKYEILVKLNHNDKSTLSLSFKILPKWYQTLGFKISAVLLIAAILWLLYRFRIRQLKKVFAVRQKISRDLHDDVSSTLSSINMYSEVAKMQQGNPQFLSNIQENAKEALEKLDDIVWANNPKNDFVKSVIERIKSFAQPLARANDVSFSIVTDGLQDDTKISSASRQSLFLICKEAVNNAVKYAACENIRIDLKVKSNKVFCEIADDGKGFDLSQPTERNGLYNMQQRAESLKGKYAINTSPGKGTSITVELPL